MRVLLLIKDTIFHNDGDFFLSFHFLVKQSSLKIRISFGGQQGSQNAIFFKYDRKSPKSNRDISG